MKDEELDHHLDALLRDAAETYHKPPALGDADATWAAIEAALPPAAAARPTLSIVREAPVRRSLWANPWLRAAAVLLLGVAIGRVSAKRDLSTVTRLVSAAMHRQAPEGAASAASDGAPGGAVVAAADLAATSEYLGRTQALLAQLPDELHARRSDPAYLAQADALLLQTRLLQDSPAASDPALHSLFDDLEIVLAQLVRLRSDRDPTRIDFLNQAMEQRDVMPRLRDAVADNAGD